ncbi:MAG: SigB/SigF/SigG family RNA polymerase sigma factor [Bacilli bacterium]
MAKNSVDITGIVTSKIKVLKNDEKVELFKKYQSGDLSAKDSLVNGNLKLVLSILRKYHNRSDNMDDLFQIGCVGLIKAIDNFDLAHEVRFSTYAVPMIEGEIKRYIRDNSPVRVSRGIKETAYKILRFKDDYISKFGSEPETSSIASYLGITEFEVGNALMSLKEPVSIFEPIYNDGGDTIYLLDQLEDKKDSLNMDDLISVRKALEAIKPREKDVLVKRFMTGKTQAEIADEIGISQAQVSRIEKTAILSLKRILK